MSWGLVDNDGVGGCCGVMDTRQQSGTAGGNQTTSSAQRSEYLRDKALAAAIDDGGSVAGAARRYGVSRQRAYKIKRRWDADGDSGLPPRSRAARTIANRTDAVPASRIVELRKQLEKDGPDAGAESIACFASIFLKQFLHYFSAVWAAGFQQELHHMTAQTRTGTGPPCLYIPET